VSKFSEGSYFYVSLFGLNLYLLQHPVCWADGADRHWARPGRQSKIFIQEWLWILVWNIPLPYNRQMRDSLKKVKQSHYRPGQTLKVPGSWGCQISRHSAHEGGEVVSPTHRLPLPPGNIPGTHFWQEAESTPGSLCSRKDVNKKFQWHHRESTSRPTGL
jgi:hypothetical protein